MPSRRRALGGWVRGGFFKNTLSVNEGWSLPNVFLKILCMGCVLLGVGLLGGISYLKAIESSEVRSVEDLKAKVSQQEEMLFFWKKSCGYPRNFRTPGIATKSVFEAIVC